MVWITVSENGISKAFVLEQKQAINQTKYLRKCIKACFMPFIEKYHCKENVLFWPDLARRHYARQVTEYFDQNGIQFVCQQKNPQNCPQARPVETF